METKQEENSATSKKQNSEVEGEMVEVTKTEGKKKHMKVKGPVFEVKEYAFS